MGYGENVRQGVAERNLGSGCAQWRDNRTPKRCRADEAARLLSVLAGRGAFFRLSVNAGFGDVL
jgi:hypothetical protein